MPRAYHNPSLVERVIKATARWSRCSESLIDAEREEDARIALIESGASFSAIASYFHWTQFRDGEDGPSLAGESLGVGRIADVSERNRLVFRIPLRDEAKAGLPKPRVISVMREILACPDFLIEPPVSPSCAIRPGDNPSLQEYRIGPHDGDDVIIRLKPEAHDPFSALVGIYAAEGGDLITNDDARDELWKQYPRVTEPEFDGMRANAREAAGRDRKGKPGPRGPHKSASRRRS